MTDPKQPEKDADDDAEADPARVNIDVNINEKAADPKPAKDDDRKF